ncbi:MAG: thioredoxin domain-containing protein [Proteobacteria bacterium]|nr:thioredoxin domain-containing protein [Pseudomonadota bacterium]
MNPRRPLLAAAALATTLAAFAAPALLAAPPRHAATGAGGNWNAVVAMTPAGTHVVGNPAAKVKLIEYVSYTCPHCAHFEEQSAAGLQLFFVSSGKGSIEVRNFLRDPADLAVALITNCLPPRRFFGAHQAFLRQQSVWLGRSQKIGQAQLKRWYEGPQPARMRAIAADLDLYAIAQGQGLDHAATDRCLTNEAMVKRLTDLTVAADKAGVDSTPSFAINGTLLYGTHDWTTLEPQLKVRM